MNEYFFPKLDDFIKKNCYADSAKLQYFLNPAEQYEVETYIKLHHNNINMNYNLYGGYEFAERRMFIINPHDIDILSVQIKSSGFHTLKHKDYLGAVLALGIERWCIGDIVVTDNGAIIFTTDKIHEFLLSDEKPLEHIGRDKVSLENYILPDGFNIIRESTEITGVISSARLDSVVSVLTKLSREKAKAIITAGNVQLNFAQEYDNDTPINSGDVISIRGYGRFNIKNVSQKTRKDRIKLIALKNI